MGKVVYDVENNRMAILVYVNSNTNTFEVELEDVNMKAKIQKHLNLTSWLAENYPEVGEL